MQRASLKKVGKRVAQIVLPLAILSWIVYTMRDGWSQLNSQNLQFDPWFIVLSFLLFVLQVLSYGLVWRTILRRLGARLDLRHCLRIYLGSEFVRYIPGNVWHVLTRIIWVGKYGVSRPVAFASMAIELITKLAAGVFIFAVSLLFWQDLGSVGKWLNGTPIIIPILGVVTIVALLVGLHPRVLNRLMNLALRLLKREPIVLTLRYSDILSVTLAWCVSWLIAGCAFYFLLLAFWTTAPLAILPMCIGIYAIAWDIGFVSFITPSGLGIREVTIATLLPFGLAGILAIISRIVSTLAELVCVSLAYFIGGKQVHVMQQEQRNQSPVETNMDGDNLVPLETERGDMSRVKDATPIRRGMGSD